MEPVYAGRLETTRAARRGGSVFFWLLRSLARVTGGAALSGSATTSTSARSSRSGSRRDPRRRRDPCQEFGNFAPRAAPPRAAAEASGFLAAPALDFQLGI